MRESCRVWRPDDVGAKSWKDKHDARRADVRPQCGLAPECRVFQRPIRAAEYASAILEPVGAHPYGQLHHVQELLRRGVRLERRKVLEHDAHLLFGPPRGCVRGQLYCQLLREWLISIYLFLLVRPPHEVQIF